MKRSSTRRQFLKQTINGALGTFFIAGCSFRRTLSPNEKLSLGIIGVANQGAYNLENVAGENIAALCDVDEKFLASASQKFPYAKTYTDFRRLLDRKDLDAVVIATPDHTHAVAALRALKRGLHVYCEKPLARTISETRKITEAARRHKRATQIGTQIHAGSNYRRVVELVQSGAIGQVSEVHVWVPATYGNKERPTDAPPVPAHLHYDLWLGPVEYRPYHPDYLPFNWRHWWAFAGGALADFGCHYLDLPHWALDLRVPLTAEAEGPPVHPDSTPPWLIVRYTYPSRGDKPMVNLTWYHGGKMPESLTPEQAMQWKAGVLFIGKKGSLISDYGKHQLLPEKEFEGFVPPAPFIPDSIGHHKEWIEACKTGGSTTCAFDYSGPLTEAALLGNVAYRAGNKIHWDSRAMKAVNFPEADRYIQHHYRKGWRL